MRKHRCISLLLLALVATASAGPISWVTKASKEDDAQAKQFAPDAARALIYVYRDKALMGKSLKSQFVVNNKVVAVTESGRFSLVSLEPGQYNLMSVSSNESNLGAQLIHNANKKSVDLTAEAGKIYYFQEIFKPMGGFSLKPLSADEAQPLIKKSKLREVARP